MSLEQHEEHSNSSELLSSANGDGDFENRPFSSTSPPSTNGQPSSSFTTTTTTTTTAATATTTRATGGDDREDDDGLTPAKHAFARICLACRTGDFEAVDSLLSTPNLDINQVDEYDNSPLILSSLCGHIKIVELLLQRGAVCDRDTFEGARCVYGALTDEIRDLLVSFDISKAVDVNQPFAAHIASLLNSSAEKDILFKIQLEEPATHVSGDEKENKVLELELEPQQAQELELQQEYIGLHRFLLAARSPFFKRKLFSGDWKDNVVVTLPKSVTIEAFQVIVDYLYLRTSSMALTDKSIQKKVRDLAKEYQLQDLVEGLDEIVKAQSKKEQYKIKHNLAITFVEKARKDLDIFLAENILLTSVQVPLNFDQEVDFEDIDCLSYLSQKDRAHFLQQPSIPDVVLGIIDLATESVFYYPGNKSILARSEYFDTMFKVGFSASSAHEKKPPLYTEGLIKIVNRPAFEDEHLPFLQLSSSIATQEVANMVLSYLYHDDVKEMHLKHLIELLYTADELLLDRLKTMCAVRVSSYFSKLDYAEFQLLSDELDHDAYDLIRVAWQTRCDKLEQHVTKMIAHNLQYIFKDEHEKQRLASLIQDSAARIQERQDTDTIELVDDIRYYLTKKYAISQDNETFDPLSFGRDWHSENIKLYQSAVVKYERDIEIVDTMLESLNLDA